MNRAIFRIAMLVLLASFIINIKAQDSGGHFYFAGPIGSFLAQGAKIAPVTSGLPFTIRLSSAGATIEPQSFDLSGKGWDGPAKLSFTSLKYAGGQLTGSAQIQNKTGSVIEGLRLDIVGANEEYKGKDAAGKETVNTRPQTVSMSSPILLGDLAKDDQSAAVPIVVQGLSFKPETTNVTVKGVISGLYYVGGIDVNDAQIASMDIDNAGRIYIGDVVGMQVTRLDADGTHPVVVAKLPDQVNGAAVDPKTNEVYATAINNEDLFHFAPNGDKLPNITRQAAGNEAAFDKVRFGKNGGLYFAASPIWRLRNGKADPPISQAGGDDLYTKLFDVDKAGNYWIAAGLEQDRSVYFVDAGGKQSRRVAKGPDWHLGGASVPQSCRIDADGNVYVAELGIPDSEEARISVFDKEGRFIRVFGRGGKTRAQNIMPGQVFRPKDIAFGPDGRVYIGHEVAADSHSHLILIFQPF